AFLVGLAFGATLAWLFDARTGLVVGGGAMLCLAGVSAVARGGRWARRGDDQEWYDAEAMAAALRAETPGDVRFLAGEPDDAAPRRPRTVERRPADVSAGLDAAVDEVHGAVASTEAAPAPVEAR